MPDGPHKNLKLDWRWKRFAGTLHNDAADDGERSGLASHALVREILTEDNPALLAELTRYAQQPQLDLVPEDSVQRIFSKHRRSAFSGTLEKEVTFRLHDGSPPDAALEEALRASVDDQLRKASDRIEDECICGYVRGEMRKDQYLCMVDRANAIIDGLSRPAICDALRNGDKDAFAGAASKRKGIDEGPKL